MGFVSTRGMRWAFRAVFLFGMCTAVSAQSGARRESVHPLTRSLRSTGHAAADLPMDRMLLMLKPTADQQQQLAALIAAQQDPQAPEYGQWLTPEEFAARFSPSPKDIAAVAAWLEGQGLVIGEIARGGRTIEYSGTARQVELAFGTEMRHYVRDGVTHLANATEIAIPPELEGIIGGIASLNDFHA